MGYGDCSEKTSKYSVQKANGCVCRNLPGLGLVPIPQAVILLLYGKPLHDRRSGFLLTFEIPGYAAAIARYAGHQPWGHRRVRARRSAPPASSLEASLDSCISMMERWYFVTRIPCPCGRCASEVLTV